LGCKQAINSVVDIPTGLFGRLHQKLKLELEVELECKARQTHFKLDFVLEPLLPLQLSQFPASHQFGGLS